MNFNALQIVIFLLGLLLMLSTWYAVARGRASLGEGVRWSLIWTALCFFALKPGLSNRLARAVGIDSGRFLVLYVSVMVLFVCLVLLYARTRRLSREITLLVREIAIHRGNELPAPGADPARDAAPDAGAAKGPADKGGPAS